LMWSVINGTSSSMVDGHRFALYSITRSMLSTSNIRPVSLVLMSATGFSSAKRRDRAGPASPEQPDSARPAAEVAGRSIQKQR
jgi:hypothetical protein